VDPDDEDDEGCEEEPLGTDDDISDEDASDLFDTENVSGRIQYPPMLGIRIRRIRMFLGLPDPDPLVRGAN
jgi:hypothetical protein